MLRNIQKVTDWKFFLCLRRRVNLTIPNENGSFIYAWNIFKTWYSFWGVFSVWIQEVLINDRLTILLPILLLNNYKFNLYVWKINVSTLTSLNLSSFKELKIFIFTSGKQWKQMVNWEAQSLITSIPIWVLFAYLGWWQKRL